MVSPFTPGFVADNNQIAILADIGVVLLLFEVGIEIDLKRIGREQGALLWTAPAQVLIGTALCTPIFLYLGIPILGALLLGLSVAMSSSVVIVNITRSRRRTTDTATEEALPLLLRAIRWENDLLIVYSVAIGLTIAAIGTVVFGIPMALAGFVAGLSISQSRDTDSVRKAVLPFKDLLQVLFFVVIGSLIEPSLVKEALAFTGLLLLLLVLFKTIPAELLARLGKLRAKKRQLAVGLSQMGEFSFVLGAAALAEGALTKAQFTAVLLAVIISIIVSTLAVRTVGVSKKRI